MRPHVEISYYINSVKNLLEHKGSPVQSGELAGSKRGSCGAAGMAQWVKLNKLEHLSLDPLSLLRKAGCGGR